MWGFGSETVLMAGLTDRPEVSRLEVVDSGRRRRWTEDEKLRIVMESLSGPRLGSATARRYGAHHAVREAYNKRRIIRGPAAPFAPDAAHPSIRSGTSSHRSP